jgi:hypothetical protein
MYVTIGATAVMAGIITFSLSSAASPTFSYSINELQSADSDKRETTTDIGPENADDVMIRLGGGKKHRKTKRSKKASKKASKKGSKKH